MITIALLAILNTPAQSPLPREPSDVWYRRHVPVTIEVTQDVEVKPYAHEERRRRGTLEIGRDLKAFTIKKRQTPGMLDSATANGKTACAGSCV
jgi:hypothetical protein